MDGDNKTILKNLEQKFLKVTKLKLNFAKKF